MVDQIVLSARASAALALARAAIADGADTGHLDELVRDAAAKAGASSGHVSILTDRQITASVQGAFAAAVSRGDEMPFEDSICVNTLRANSLLAITDAAQDSRVSSVPAVASGAVGSYLGAPLRGRSGDMVGVLCVFDDKPHAWTEQQIAEVTRIADEVVAELRRIIDPAGSDPAGSDPAGSEAAG